jgi:hypothetical protein
MSGNIYNLKVDLKLKFTAITPTFVQYDDAQLNFQLYDNGKIFDISAYTNVEVAHRLPDGTVIVGNGEVAVNEKNQQIIRYNYLGNEMSQTGFIEASFSIFDANENKVSIRPFKVHIVKDNRDGLVEPSNPAFGLLQTYQAELLVLKDELTIAKDDAIEATTNANTNAANWKYIGVYSATVQYKKHNVVTIDGESYIAKQDNLNRFPVGDSNDLYWSTFARKGQDGTGTTVVYKDEFTATAGQTVFTLSKSYTPLTNRLRVIVDGVEQFTLTNFTETANNKFTMTSGLTVGQSVIAVYFSQAPTLANDFAEQLAQMNTLVQSSTTSVASMQTKIDLGLIEIKATAPTSTATFWLDTSTP